MTDTQRTYYVYSASTPDYMGYDFNYARSADEIAAMRTARAAWQIEGAHTRAEATGALLASFAGLYVSDAITITRLVPRQLDESERLDAARGVLRADYWQDVANVISWLRHEITAGNITDTDAATQHIDETVDGHQRVIYTGQAIECLLFSGNEDAYQDEMGEAPSFETGAHWSQLAYFAFRADIMDTIGDLDDFIAANKPRPYAECDDCGDDIETEAEAHVYADEDVTVCADCAEARDDEKKAANLDA